MIRRAAVVASAAALLTVACAAVFAPSAQASAPASGYRLLASAAAGSVYVNDPTFLIPYADQIVSQADSELSAVGAHAVATPLAPGSAASLGPTLVVVACPTCPSVPTPVSLSAEARPPTEHADASAAAAAGGPVTVDGPKASATARTGIEAEATAATTKVTGLDTTSAASATASRATLRAPADGSDGVAEARADTGFAGIMFVAFASVLPTITATAGVQQPDGSITPLAADGMPVGDGRVFPATESGPGFARSGVVFERKDAGGSVQRSTIALTSVQMLGSFAAEQSAVGSSDDSPLAANTSALGVLSATGTGPADIPTARAAFPPVDTARPARTAARSISQLGRLRDRAWLLWVYLAWLAVGGLTMAAGRRHLAPFLAARAASERRARAGRVDHLDVVT